jgi:hypothetical protein
MVRNPKNIQLIKFLFPEATTTTVMGNMGVSSNGSLQHPPADASLRSARQLLF